MCSTCRSLLHQGQRTRLRQKRLKKQSETNGKSTRQTHLNFIQDNGAGEEERKRREEEDMEEEEEEEEQYEKEEDVEEEVKEKEDSKYS